MEISPRHYKSRQTSRVLRLRRAGPTSWPVKGNLNEASNYWLNILNFQEHKSQSECGDFWSFLSRNQCFTPLDYHDVMELLLKSVETLLGRTQQDLIQFPTESPGR